MKKYYQSLIILTALFVGFIACEKENDSIIDPNYTNILSGNISGIWTLAESPYLIHGNITIPNDSVLSIEAGVIVKFAGHYKLNVQGQLIAKGTPDKMILFTAKDTTGFNEITSIKGGWHGIRFESTSSLNNSSIFSYCTIEYGKALGGNTDKFGGAIFINNFNKIRIEYCSLSNNYAEGDGGALYIHSDEGYDLNNPIQILHNKFNDNSCYNNGGALYSYRGHSIVTDNKFTGNSSYYYGGAIYSRYSKSVITGNCISKSRRGGGVLFYRSNPSIFVNNLIFENIGGGVEYIDFNDEMINSNNTIVNNSNGSGVKIYSDYCGITKLHNTIIWGNTDENGQKSELFIGWTDTEVYNCLIGEGIVKEGVGMSIILHYLNQNPIFLDNYEHPFNISSNSPCIDAGVEDTLGLSLPKMDIAGNPRISGERIDIGAYEFID